MRVPTQLLCRLACLLLLAGGALAAAAATADEDFAPIAAGPIFDKFGLTLQTGTRTEALGPYVFEHRFDIGSQNLVNCIYKVDEGIALTTGNVEYFPCNALSGTSQYIGFDIVADVCKITAL